MAKRIPKIKQRRPKGFLRTIAEMIGKIAPVNNWLLKTSLNWELYTALPSVDYSKTNYSLTRAIFYASKVTDPTSKQEVGGDFLFGAIFGKPIVNSAAAFAFAKLPEIQVEKPAKEISGSEEDVAKIEAKSTQKNLDFTQSKIGEWLEKNKADLFKLCRNSLRDGDQYIYLKDDLSVALYPPEQVEIIDNPVSGEILGFDIKVIVETVDSKGTKANVKYVTKFRKTSPYRQLIKYDTETAKEGSVIEEDKAADEDIGTVVNPKDGTTSTVTPERPLPIVGFYNERDARERYGNSEFQNCYTLMANYHAVLAAAIKNNIYNSSSVPIVTGVDDIKQWLTQNGFVDEDTGETKVSWDGDKLLIGGKDFDIKMVTAAQTAADAILLLNVLFWLICQTSETPEFVMGTAVQSSKASVSEQMPVVIRKAERKRTEYTPFFKELIELYLYKANQLDPQIVFGANYTLSWPDIVGDDMKLNLEIVKALAEEGVITDHTKMLLLGIAKYVSDIDEEITKARKELTEKQKLMATNYPPKSPQAKAKQEE